MHDDQYPQSPGPWILLYEIIFVLMAITVTLDRYNTRVDEFGLSIDRILLAVLIFSFPVYVMCRKSSFGSAQILAGLGILSVFTSAWTGQGWNSAALEFGPSLIQCYILFAIGACVFKENPRAIRIFHWIALSWAIIFLLFAAHALYWTYIKGIANYPYPFIGYIADYDPHKAAMMYGQRLFMPFASAPHLGMATGAVALFFLGMFMNGRKIIPIPVIIAMTSICILTLSRGPVLALLASFFVLLTFGRFYGVIRVDKRLLFLTLGLLVLAMGIYIFYSYQVDVAGHSHMTRLVEHLDTLQYGRHIYLRLEAVDMFMEGNLIEKIGGQGLGWFQETRPGAYSFASYLTLLAETGVFGFLVLAVAAILPVWRGWRTARKTKNAQPWYFYAFCLAIFVFTTHWFYELKTVRVTWLVHAFVFGITATKPYLPEDLEDDEEDEEAYYD